jgi:hypothetical protein
MGVMTQKHENLYIITSDRGAADPPNKMAPKRRSTTALHVWTGDHWSTDISHAKTFPTAEAADAYTQTNVVRVMHGGGTSPEK